MTSGRPQVIVVDAANVVGSRPDGWWRDRAGAARRLLVKLAALQERLQDTTEIIVILEGAARAAVKGPETPDTGTLRIVLAEASGDDTIVAVTAKATARGNNPAPTTGGSIPHDNSPAHTSSTSHDNSPTPSTGSTTNDIGGVPSAGPTDGNDGSSSAASTGADKPTVTVVTADRGLRQRIEPLGATAVGPRWLLDQLDA